MTSKLFRTTRLLGFGLLVCALAFASACKDDDGPSEENEQELITTVTLRLIGTSAPIDLTFRDLDGPAGGSAAVIMGGTLDPNKTYTYTASFLNEQGTPAEDITAEIRDEGVDHQIFFQATGVPISTTYGDTDANGRPIGLTGTLTTTTSGTGSLTMTLRHQPNKAADGVSGGNIANADGETDAVVVFPITVR